VYLVALTELRGDLDQEAGPLAALLSLSPYDVKARLSGPLPKILAQIGDEGTARAIQRGLAARGHGAVVCDPRTVARPEERVRMHRFTIEDQYLWANDREGERLSWSDIGAVIIALVRSPVARTKEEIEYPVVPSRTPQTVKHDVTKTEHTSVHTGYLFPHRRASGQRPWVIEETTAQFLSLGARMQPTRRANFLTTLGSIRRLAPQAIVDDRFVAYPLTSTGLLRVRGSEQAPAMSPSIDVDATIHILARWLLGEYRGPYR
jgi:hypothetical protein